MPRATYDYRRYAEPLRSITKSAEECFSSSKMSFSWDEGEDDKRTAKASDTLLESLAGQGMLTDDLGKPLKFLVT